MDGTSKETIVIKESTVSRRFDFFNCELICPMHTYVSNTRNASTNFISYLPDLEELIFSEMS